MPRILSLQACALIVASALRPGSARGQETDGPKDADAGLVEFDVEGMPPFETVVEGSVPAEDGLSRERIDREDLRRRGSTTVAAAVEHEVAVYASGGRKGERQLRLRGFDQRGVNLYLDGVPFVSPYGGGGDLGKIPTELVESVLVVKGPSSVVLGPGGMGGTVAIETRNPARAPLMETELEFGGSGEGRATAFHALDAGPFAYAVGAGITLSEGYRLSSQSEATEWEDGGGLDNSDRRIVDFVGKLAVPIDGSNRFTASAFVLDGEFGVPRATTDVRPFYTRFSIWRAVVGQVAHVLEAGPLRLEEAIYAVGFDNRFDSYDDETFTTMDGPNAYMSWYHDRSFGGRIRGSYALCGREAGATILRLWLSAQHAGHDTREQQDERLDRFRRISLTAVPELEVPVIRGLVLLAAVQVEGDLPDTGGAEVDTGGPEYRDEDRWLVSPLAEARFDPVPELMLRLSGARRGRIPTLSERYSSRLGFTRANPGLEPETAWYVQLDASWEPLRALALDASAFDAELDEVIEDVYLPETNGVTQKQNLGRARLAGGEVAVRVRPLAELELHAGYAYLFARRLGSVLKDDRIAQIPAHQAVFGIVARPVKWAEAASTLRVVGPQAFADYNILGLGELGTYAVWD
ncbi:MAG TPA: TonB-dependent receptor, partial [Polyangia bacterium]|nr:TonB-dependent receptor [Polyangia bacterium]